MANSETVFQALAARFGARFSARMPDRTQRRGAESYHDLPPPDAVIWPETTAEVAEIARLCHDAGVPMIPYGAGSSLEGNAAAAQGGLCIDLTRMDRVLAVNPQDLDCTVQAGVTREALNTHLRDSGLFFPIDPGANATIGGMASTRASGTNAVRYGTMREAVLALTVVTPQGQIIRTGGRARKSAAGYDLTRLFVGSEGTLGIVTEITLRLHGRPEAVRAAICTFDGPGPAVRTAIAAIQIGLPMARIEYLDSACITAVNAWSGLTETVADSLLVEFHGSAAGIQEQVDLFAELVADNGGSDFRWAEREEERNKLWAARHSAYNATLGQRPGSRGWVSDVCVPLSQLPACIEAAKTLLADCPVPSAIMGHVGDGNFHVVFAMDPDAPDERAIVSKINSAMVAEALARDGTCTGEHGIGIGKQRYMQAEFGPALDVMRALKAALDPQGVMNPGKILPPPTA